MITNVRLSVPDIRVPKSLDEGKVLTSIQTFYRPSNVEVSFKLKTRFPEAVVMTSVQHSTAQRRTAPPNLPRMA